MIDRFSRNKILLSILACTAVFLVLSALLGAGFARSYNTMITDRLYAGSPALSDIAIVAIADGRGTGPSTQHL
jgi:hypothetical protein